jgi:spermidine synthase
MALCPILFFFSGFSCLIYEVVWARSFSLVFGSTTTANTLVITAFMLGMGIGSIFFGLYADRTKESGRLFSFLQFGIGIFSFLLMVFLPRLPYLYKGIVIGFNLNQTGSILLIFLVAFVFLLIPTFLMGGTFPVISRVYIMKDKEIKKGIGLLYGLNTLGGIAGALLAGFFLIRNLGLALTQVIAISLNIGIGIIFFLFSLHCQVKSEISEIEIQDFKSENAKGRGLTIPTKYLLIIAGLTGFASLACEVLWIRAFSIFLTNSSYTFTIILIVFLTGIFTGSLVFTRVSEKKDFHKIFAIVQILTGLYIVIGCIFLNRLSGLLFAIRQILEIPIFRIFLPGLVLSFVVLFIPTIFMGISFLLLCSLCSQGIKVLGNKIGRVYFMNTIGSALGSLIAGFFLIHFLGVIRGLLIVAFINLFTGILFTMFQKKKVANLVLFGITMVISIFAIQRRMILPPSIYHTAGRQDRVLYYRETRDGTVIVSEDRNTGTMSCYVNNSAVIGTTYDALKVVKMLGNLPFVFNPKAEDVLVIGYGVGITTSAIARYAPKKIDCVEICPGLREASKYFTNFNNYIFNNPVVNFVPNDGRNFLLLSDKKYDIISCDPTHPILGSGSLYTKEYFLLCKEHLTENGVVCQYLPFHKLSPEEFRTLIRTFAEVFPYTSIWLGYSHGILVGTFKPQIAGFESLKNIKDEMLNDPYLILVSYLLDDRATNNFAGQGKINTDNQPILEFYTSVSLKKKNWELNLISLLSQRVEIGQVIRGIEDVEKMQRYIEGQKYFISGLVFQNQGNQRLMIQEFEKALEVNSENQEIRRFLGHQ